MYQESSFNWRTSRLNLQGFTSFFRNIPAAIRLAQPDGSMSMKSVLFVLSIQNHRGFHGIHLHSENCSAHYHEQQVILIEKFEVYVMAMEEKIIT